MAELFEEKIVIAISRAVPNGTKASTFITKDMILSLEAVMAELLETPGAVVEIRLAE